MNLDYSVSARKKLARQSIKVFLELAYPFLLKNGNIKSIFGFREMCGLYGGRSFFYEELSQRDIHWMYDNDIGYRIPIQNLVVNYSEYKQEKGFLQKYHRSGNTVIVAKNDLAEWIRNDFPEYKIEGSFIRRYNSVDKIISDLEIYDTVVPDPAIFATDYELLDKLPRDRVRLFTNAYCALACKKRTCYLTISTDHLGRKIETDSCCGEGIRRETVFDVDKYKEMGFYKLKSMKVSSIYAGL